MGDTVGCQLADSLKTFNSHLHFLAVGNNGLTDKFAEVLADSLRIRPEGASSTKITYIELSRNSITNDGAKTLSRATVGTHVKRIWLGLNEVSRGLCLVPLADDSLVLSNPIHAFDYIPAQN